MFSSFGRISLTRFSLDARDISIKLRRCGTRRRNPEKARRFVKEQFDKFIKQVKEWHEDCRDNEQQTKQI
jgi:hypothetical protein